MTTEPTEAARKLLNALIESGFDQPIDDSIELDIIQRHMDLYHAEQSKKLVEWLKAEKLDDEAAQINARDHGEWDRYHRLEGHKDGLIHVVHHLRTIDTAMKGTHE
jgi:hypothetical protein